MSGTDVTSSHDTNAAPEPGPEPGQDETRLVPRRLGGYEVIAQIGHGGMAQVFLGEDASGAQVALKILAFADPGGSDEERFLREGEVLEGLDHPNVVRLHERGHDDTSGRAFIALELVSGRDLRAVLSDAPGRRLPPPLALYVVDRCARALAAVHALGVIHRDIKPANVLLTPEGEVKVTDFGIALALEQHTRLTAADELVGTPHYVAPEVIGGAEWTPAADIYALGALAFRITAGRHLFPHKDPIDVVRATRDEDPPAVLEHAPELPAPAATLIDRMISRDPLERPDAAEITRVLRPFAASAEAVASALETQGALARKKVSARLRRDGGLDEREVFHHYRIDRELGRGGMGVVYQAHHLGLRKTVALKVLLAGAVASADERRRFLQEAEAAASLCHPAVVQVLDAGEHEGTYFLTMEYVDGLPLDRYLATYQGGPEPLLELFAKVCEGVQHAHSHGIVHRDLKPDNVIVDGQGQPHILDFGIAKAMDRDDGQSRALTTEGDILGTLRYMPPEQAAGKVTLVDERSDVYALGSILYEMLTGTTPFTGSPRELLVKIHLEEPLPPSKLRPGLPWEVDAICLKALEKERDHRYPSALALQDDVRRFVEGRPIQARRATAGYRARKWLARNRRRASLAAGLLLGVVALAGLGLHRASERRDDRAREATAAVEEGWTRFHRREYGAAAQAFARAGDLLPGAARIPFTPDLDALIPADRAPERAEAVTLPLVQRWLALARAREPLEVPLRLLDQARSALDADRLVEATDLVVQAERMAGEGRTPGALASRLARRWIAAGAAELTSVALVPRKDHEERERRLTRARDAFEQARRVDPSLAPAQAGAASARALLAQLEQERARQREADERRARAERQVEVRVSPAGGVIADGESVAHVEIRARDASGGPRAGRTALLQVEGPGRKVILQPGPTDARGIATGAVVATVAGITTLTVLLDPGPEQVVLDQRPTVRFDPGPLDPQACSLTLGGSEPGSSGIADAGRIADGAQLTPVTVVLCDAQGNRLPGRRVELEAEGEGVTLVQPDGPTGPDGAARGAIAARVAGLKVVRALVDTGPRAIRLPRELSVRFDPGPPSAARSSLTVAPLGALVADAASVATVTVVVRDALGNPIEGQAIKLEASGSGNLLRQPEALSDAQGLVRGALTSSVAELKTITAVVNPGPEQVVVAQRALLECVPGAPDPRTSTLRLAGELVADGASVTSFVVAVLDQRGNPVPGQRVELVVSGAGNRVVQPREPTGLDGRARGTLVSSVAEVKTITAVIDPGPRQVVLAEPTVVRARPGGPSAQASQLRVTPASGLVADAAQVSTISVVVLDACGNPVPGQTVKLEASGRGNALVQPEAVTDAEGRAWGAIASSVAEVKTLTAIVNPGSDELRLGGERTVEFVAGRIDAQASLLAARPAGTGARVLVADGRVHVVLEATLTDARGNPVRGAKVRFVVSGAGNQLVQPAEVTGPDGVARGALRSTVAEEKRVTCVVSPGPDEVRLTASTTLRFVPGAVAEATSELSVRAPPGLVADGAVVVSLSVVLRDAGGNPVSDKAVRFLVSGEGNALDQPDARTDAEGRAEGGFASTVAEPKEVRVVVDPGPDEVRLNLVRTVELKPGPLDVRASAVTLTRAADPAGAGEVRVTLRDALGNPIPGVRVELTADGGARLEPSGGVSDERGALRVRLLASSDPVTIKATAYTRDGPRALRAYRSQPRAD